MMPPNTTTSGMSSSAATQRVTGLAAPLASDGPDMRGALRLQIEALAKRNEMHSRNRSVAARIQEMDLCIVRLRELLSRDPPLAFRFYLECVSFADETERVLSKQRVMINVADGTMKRGGASPPPRADFSSSNVLTSYESPVEETNWEEADKFYYNSKWWRIICLNGAKEGLHRGEGVRDLWNSQIEFFLSCLGFIVGVGSTLRFPAKVYQHGGGVFFIPYSICMLLFGLPIVYMHLAIGQYSGLSASGAFWRLMPISSGIGWSLVLLAVPVAIYYNIIVAWAVYYFWFSIRGFFSKNQALPWESCRPDWVTKYACCDLRDYVCLNVSGAMAAPEAYFHYEVLGRSHDDLSLGPLQEHLVVALAVAWIFVFFGVFKGIGSIGWTAAVTATVPYLLLLILLMRGISLPGARQGLSFLFTPDFDKLWSLGMWKSAAEQVFYELGIDAGPLISMASFSRYRKNIYRDAVLLVIIDAATSVLSGMVIFSFIGFLAHMSGSAMTDVLKHDPSYLAFSVYPGVTSFMSIGALWAALFFAMLVLSALDAEFAWLEMIASAIMYQLGLKNKQVEDRILSALCVCGFVAGIPLCCKGGIYVFHAIESLNANWNSFSLGLAQIVLVCYCYGVDDFLDDISRMLRLPEATKRARSTWRQRLAHVFGPTGSYIKWCWCLCCPAILTALLVASAFSYTPIRMGSVLLPRAYEAVAWLVMVTPLAVIPFTAAYTLFDARRRGRPLSSVFCTKEWRKANDLITAQETRRSGGDGSSSAFDGPNAYMYIDPASRAASTRSRALFAENDYGRMAGRIADLQQIGGEVLDDDEVASQRRPPSTISSARDEGPLEMSLFGAPPALRGLSESLKMRERLGGLSGETSLNEPPSAVHFSPSTLSSPRPPEKPLPSFRPFARRFAFYECGGPVSSAASEPPIPRAPSLASLPSTNKQSRSGDGVVLPAARARCKSMSAAAAAEEEEERRRAEAASEEDTIESSRTSSPSFRGLTGAGAVSRRQTVVRRPSLFPSTDSIDRSVEQSSISITPIDAQHRTRSISSIAIYDAQAESRPRPPTNKLSMLKRPAPIDAPPKPPATTALGAALK